MGMLSQAEIREVCREYPFYAPHVEQIVVPGLTADQLRVLLDLLVTVTLTDFNDALREMLFIHDCRTPEEWVRLVMSCWKTDAGENGEAHE